MSIQTSFSNSILKTYKDLVAITNDAFGKDDRPDVWICETKDNKPFNVPSKGTREERSKLFENGAKHIGKMLSVQYFELTSDGVPRFPKTLRTGESSVRTSERRTF